MRYDLPAHLLRFAVIRPLWLTLSLRKQTDPLALATLPAESLTTSQIREMQKQLQGVPAQTEENQQLQNDRDKALTEVAVERAKVL